LVKAKTASLIAKIISIVMVLASWISNQFLNGKYPMTETIMAAGAITAFFADISINTLADKFSKKETECAKD
jgi:hypothetical protein